MFLKSFLAAAVISFPILVNAQFAPPAGVPGTTAMYRDSTAFTGWASACTVQRGFVNISDTNFIYWVNPETGSNHAYFGVPENATGKADDTLVVSLGDGGIATLTFPGKIFNGPGYDFAVFENALNDSFLELAFVEVSSDGINFFRFPCTSLTGQTVQVPTFGTLDATKIDNLAGKYRFGYGTPFDLDTLRNIAGLDIGNITTVRVIDVVGCIQDAYATHDALGNKVNDLWPTPFNTCGFDLDAVGVIHFHPQGITEKDDANLKIFPDPAKDFIQIRTNKEISGVSIYSFAGTRVMELGKKTMIDIRSLAAGFYIVAVEMVDGTISTGKITIQK